MKKKILVAFLATALLFLGATLASAGNISWTILTDSSVAAKGPGADGVIGQGTDPADNCNFNAGENCASAPAPSIGSFSYTYLDFQMANSCGIGADRGKSCSTNADCDGGLGCVACGDETYAYFYKNPAAALNRGLGSLVIENCSSGITYKNMSVGISEAIAGSGGGCITLQAGGDDSGSPCGVGAFTSTIDMTLWVNLLGTCDLSAGNIPDIGLDGRVYDASAAATAGVCGYNTGGIETLLDAAGNSGYVMVACESKTLPSDLASVCISGAPFEAVIVTSTSGNASDCPDCSGGNGGGCVAGTAEGVE